MCIQKVIIRRIGISSIKTSETSVKIIVIKINEDVVMTTVPKTFETRC